MLASVAEALAERGLHIESITTNLQHRHATTTNAAAASNPESVDDVDFVIDADCVVCRYLNQEQMQSLVHDLQHLQQGKCNIIYIYIYVCVYIYAFTPVRAPEPLTIGQAHPPVWVIFTPVGMCGDQVS